MSTGYNNGTAFDNLGIKEYQLDNEVDTYVDGITFEPVNNGNYQSLLLNSVKEEYENENEDEDEAEANEVLKNRVSINDVLKDSSINQFFFGGITVIGLYVVFQLIKKSK